MVDTIIARKVVFARGTLIIGQPRYESQLWIARWKYLDFHARYFCRSSMTRFTSWATSNDSVTVGITARISSAQPTRNYFLATPSNEARESFKALRASFPKAVRGNVRTFCGACSHLTRCVFSRWGYNRPWFSYDRPTLFCDSQGHASPPAPKNVRQ